MRWTKPSRAWQWMYLLTPALIMTMMGAVVPAFLATGHRRAEVEIGYGLWGLLIAPFVALLLGFWLTRGPQSSPLARLGAALLAAVSILLCNLLIAFGGCVAMSAFPAG